MGVQGLSLSLMGLTSLQAQPSNCFAAALDQASGDASLSCQQDTVPGLWNATATYQTASAFSLPGFSGTAANVSGWFADHDAALPTGAADWYLAAEPISGFVLKVRTQASRHSAECSVIAPIFICLVLWGRVVLFCGDGMCLMQAAKPYQLSHLVPSLPYNFPAMQLNASLGGLWVPSHWVNIGFEAADSNISQLRSSLEARARALFCCWQTMRR